jgi:hypothetical protein
MADVLMQKIYFDNEIHALKMAAASKTFRWLKPE